MLFVLPGILLIGVVLLLCWSLFFRTAVQKEQGVREERRRTDEIERLLDTPGEPLYCVHCAKELIGPLPASGCPECGSRSLVVPVRCLPNGSVIPAGEGNTAEERAKPATHESAAETPETLSQRNTTL